MRYHAQVWSKSGWRAVGSTDYMDQAFQELLYLRTFIHRCLLYGMVLGRGEQLGLHAFDPRCLAGVDSFQNLDNPRTLSV